MPPDDHSYAPASRGKSAESGVTIVPSVCPHDCTSTCALDVERLSQHAHRPGARLDCATTTRRA